MVASHVQSETEPADCGCQTQLQVTDYLQEDRRERRNESMIHPTHSKCRQTVWNAQDYSCRKQTSFLGMKPIKVILGYLLGLMDSNGKKTSDRETSAGAASVWEGDISSSVAPRLDWELRRDVGGSAVNAGIGFGATFAPDLFWRSLRVGLDCCLSLTEEEWASHCQRLLCVPNYFDQSDHSWINTVLKCLKTFSNRIRV